MKFNGGSCCSTVDSVRFLFLCCLLRERKRRDDEWRSEEGIPSLFLFLSLSTLSSSTRCCLEQGGCNLLVLLIREGESRSLYIKSGRLAHDTASGTK